MRYLGRAHALASICTILRCLRKFLLAPIFGGITSWYQSFSLSELSIDGRIPRLKLYKLTIMSPTLGRVLGGESVLSHTEVHESEFQ